MFPTWRRRRRVSLGKGLSLTYGRRGLGAGVGRTGQREVALLSRKAGRRAIATWQPQPIGAVTRAVLSGVAGALFTCVALVMSLGVFEAFMEWRYFGVVAQITCVVFWVGVSYATYRAWCGCAPVQSDTHAMRSSRPVGPEDVDRSVEEAMRKIREIQADLRRSTR